jgi:hypothetical protein
VFGKQTYVQIRKAHKLSINTIKKHLDSVSDFSYPNVSPGSVVLGIDATFMGVVGIALFRGSIKGVNLLWRFIEEENHDVYIKGILELKQNGWIIKGIVCDGKNLGLGEKLNLPVQMCHFHQMQIVRRYLTLNPRLDASRQLKRLSDLLPKLTEQKFTLLLDTWYQRWGEFLKEKTKIEGTRRYFYTHKRIRSAYFSLRNNLPFLFTFEHQRKLGINYPNTNNSVEGYFSDLKKKVNLHQGLRLDRKLKLIHQLLAKKAPEI